jgi:hypothetical protein
MVNRKGYRSKYSLSNLKYYPDTGLKKLRKTTKTLIQDNRFPGRDLKTLSPEYKVSVLTTRQRRSVWK